MLWVIPVLLGIVVRALPYLSTDFPLGDGGLFLSMARDVRASGFALPELATYNGLEIPFAYPPVGIYLLAASEGLGLRGTDAMRIIPLLASVATIPMVYLIGRELTRSNWMAAGTAAFFAASTGSFEWLVMGGGITRAPGFLVALVAVWLVIRAYRASGWWPSVLAGAVAGLTGLVHLQAAVFAAVSAVVLLPFLARLWGGARRLLIVGAVAALVVSPWVALVLARHGLDPFLAAAGSGGTPFVGVLNILSSRSSGGVVEVLGIATMAGLAICAYRGFWLPVVWAFAIVIVDSRAGQPYLSLPAALAITFALWDIGAVVSRAGSGAARSAAGVASSVSRPAVLLAALFLGAASVDALAAQQAPDSPMRAIGSDARDAMAWVQANTPEESRFAVVSGRYWAVDAEAEWFPTLADRQSVATVQGTEWLDRDRFATQVQRAGDLPVCVVTGDEACVEQWFGDVGRVDYLFLVDSPPDAIGGVTCCHALVDLLGSVGTPTEVHADGSVILVRLDPGS